MKAVAIYAVGPLLAALSFAATSPPSNVVVNVGVNVIDPGPRLGSPAAGGPLPGLGSSELAFFASGQASFEEIDSVTGTIPGQPGIGLGPRFNLNSCAGCHTQPSTGGSSPSTNPQIAMATDSGATNTIPSFITINGPIREAHFVSAPGGSYDGQVHDLFVVTGRSDAPIGCSMTQPDFAGQPAGNTVFRIPSPAFGDGLVEAVPDASLIAAQNVSLNNSLGIISGNFNYSEATGQISRFGWKAQNQSLLQFSGEAYNIEVGVTNDLFPLPRQVDQPVCDPNGSPEDTATATSPSEVSAFSAFMRFLAPPAPSPGGYTTATVTVTAGSIANGQSKFASAGCIACHIQNQTTGHSSMTGQSNLTFSPFSDFAVHGMGTTLADGIVQALANGDEFRTAPLWGMGQRLFFLHDGRTSDILQAILLHSSAGSEANQTIANFNALSTSDQQDLLNFLRSL